MMQEWLKANSPVDKEDLARHDKWLCMMMPRLKLLRELLRDDGVIFISIDDNEVHHLRMLMDEIFGEENFIASVIWQKKYATANDHQGIAPMHDYLIVFCKTNEFKRNLLPRTEKNDSQYRYKDGQGVFRISDYTCNKSADERPNLYYPVVNPNTKKEIYPKKEAVWRYTLERHLENEAKGLVYWGKDGKASVPSFKRYKHLLKNKGKIVPSTWWHYEFAGHTDEAKKEIREILFDAEENSDFITPKPSKLLKRVLQIGSDEDSIILDSFAGSGTTAQAVLSLNQEDGGDRKFILIEMEDYAKSLTAERVRRVIKGVANAKDVTLKNGLPGTFSFFELGEPVEMQAILEGDSLPAYEDLARYVFYTATGDEFDLAKVDQGRNFIGENREFEVYLLYQPDLNYLRSTALDLDKAEKLGLPEPNCKKRLVFAPMKYLDTDTLERYRIEYCQLPFEIYKFKE
jgi:adenine-specific DNA-methyltransferase